MNMTFVKLAVIHISVLYIFLPVGNTCGPTEFRSSQGSVVYRDCSGDLSTTCIPCSPGTFMNEPNGLYKCFKCRKCNESQGLYIQSQCNTIKDTVCDVLEGYHCTDYSNGQCLLAQKHSVCKPGQETKAPGTKFSDTVCEDSPYGFY
nr:tumor necrosis factor receptor superfamily member 14-like isoform X2 [Misgurnus anguillicaudatus]